jgi:hypothetical protein
MPLPENKEEKQRLGAGHLNEMSRVLNIVGAQHVGAYGFGNEKGAQAASPPAEIRRVEVTFDAFDGDEDMRTIELMYYDTATSTWEKDAQQGPWPLDPLDLDAAVGDDFIAYFDIQRGAYLPVGGAGGGGDLIGFTITSVDCLAGTVGTTDASIVRYTQCTTPPGDDEYGEYTIYDFFGFIADLTETELLGGRALAIYWNVRPGCTPRWDLLMAPWTGGC